MARLTRNPVVWATAVGALLRCGSFIANLGFPHGDVNLDAGTAESLARGLGFWTPWEEGSSLRPDAIGLSPREFGHCADQHGPLWPLLGTPFTWLTGGHGVVALQIVSLLAGILTIPMAAKLFGRISERAGQGAAWAMALALPLCDYSGNGSLYTGQVLGLLALPLVAGEMDRPRRAAAAGLLLGLLFLLNYQCAAVIVAFGVGVLAARGVKAMTPLAIAAAACVGICLPWFIRNYWLFGNPLYTTNLDFVVGRLGMHSIDLTGERPLVTHSATTLDILRGVAQWTPFNLAYWTSVVHLALPVLPLFAPGGFARLLTLRADGRRSLVGVILLSSFIGLLLITAGWPTPKARYVVPLMAILAGVGMAELTEGARFLPAIAMSVLTLLCGWAIDAPNAMGFPWKESRFLLPTLLLPALAFAPKLRPALPLVAIVLIAMHGAFRVYISIDRIAAAKVFDVKVEGESMFGPPSPTFYDVFGGPVTEGFDKAQLVELKRVAQRLDTMKVQRCIGPVELAYFWKGSLVTIPQFAKRFDLGVLPKTLAAFAADGLVIPLGMLADGAVRSAMNNWLVRNRATVIFGVDDRPNYFAAYFVPI